MWFYPLIIKHWTRVYRGSCACMVHMVMRDRHWYVLEAHPCAWHLREYLNAMDGKPNPNKVPA